MVANDERAVRLGLVVILGVVPVDEVLQGVFERVFVDVLLEKVLVVELQLQDGLLVELGDGEFLGWLEVELPLGEVGLDGLMVPLRQSHGQEPSLPVCRGPEPRSGPGRDRLGISIEPWSRLRKDFVARQE